VRKHLDNAYAKLDVHSRTVAVMRAFPRLAWRAGRQTSVD
jgi:DNA-binding CsgD family transcriptional regulator